MFQLKFLFHTSVLRTSKSLVRDGHSKMVPDKEKKCVAEEVKKKRKLLKFQQKEKTDSKRRKL